MHDFTHEEVIDACKESGGTIAAVARKLQCGWGTAREYINNNHTAKSVMEASKQEHLDVAIDVAMDIMQNGEEANRGRMSLEIMSRRGGEKWRKRKTMTAEIPEEGIVVNIVQDVDEPEPESDKPQDFVG